MCLFLGFKRRWWIKDRGCVRKMKWAVLGWTGSSKSCLAQ